MLNPLERLFYKELFGARMRPVGRHGPGRDSGTRQPMRLGSPPLHERSFTPLTACASLPTLLAVVGAEC